MSIMDEDFELHKKRMRLVFYDICKIKKTNFTGDWNAVMKSIRDVKALEFYRHASGNSLVPMASILDELFDRYARMPGIDYNQLHFVVYGKGIDDESD
jgi:hypothetical protein